MLPPISVVQVGDAYAIRDGHHRVSVARARGARQRSTRSSARPSTAGHARDAGAWEAGAHDPRAPVALELTRELTDVCMGREPADLVIRGGRLVNVHTREVLDGADVAIAHGRVAMFGDVAHTRRPADAR